MVASIDASGSGINNGTAPISDYFAAPNTAQANIQTAFSTYLTSIGATASTITATQMQTFLSSPSFTSQFQSPGWSAPGSNWSQASSTNVSSNISPNETIDTSTNANKPEFGQLAQAYVMLNEFTGSGVNADAYQVVVTAATGLVSDALTSMTATEAQVGAVTQQVAEATSNMSAQMGVLQTQIGNLDNANAYQTATRVSSLTTQIQTAYSLTAQLQQLSLVKYL